MEQITSQPQQNKEELLNLCRKAIADVGNAYSMYVASLGYVKNARDWASQNFAIGYQSLLGIEEALDSYNHSIEEYRNLCDRYVRGWTMIFQRLGKQIQEGKG